MFLHRNVKNLKTDYLLYSGIVKTSLTRRMELVDYISKTIIKNNVHLSIDEDARFLQCTGLREGAVTNKLKQMFAFQLADSRRAVENKTHKNNTAVLVHSGAHEKKMALSQSEASFECELVKFLLDEQDPTASLLLADSYELRITEFLTSITNQLDNEKQLYKKFGYSRKRSIMSCAEMKTCLMQRSSYNEDVLDYLARVFQMKIIIVNVDDVSRQDLAADDCPDKCLYFMKVKGTIQFTDQSFQYKCLQEANRLIWHGFMAIKALSASALSTSKVTDLRKYAKLKGMPNVKGSKEELITGLQE